MAFLWGLGGVVESNIIYSFHTSVSNGNAGSLYGGNPDTALGHKGTPSFSCCLLCFVTTAKNVNQDLKKLFLWPWGFVCL